MNNINYSALASVPSYYIKMTDLKDTKLAGGKYAVQQKLGSGSFGDIYLVTTAAGEILAAKMVSSLFAIPRKIRNQSIPSSSSRSRLRSPCRGEVSVAL